ncbi:NUDIX hydrolase [Micromonospora sp. Llam7]|nr:NUDIX hydrolase [Micromonospora tarapacensis]
MSGYGKVSSAALAIVPGPDGSVTFLRQERGPYAGHWLLPGGRIEFGESVVDTARRETLEESGCEVGKLTLTGVYELRGAWADGGYHIIMFAFLSDTPAVVPAGFEGDHVGDVVQVAPHRLRPHPTVMRILNDAGVASFADDEIEAWLARDGITMVSLRTGSPVGV